MAKKTERLALPSYPVALYELTPEPKIKACGRLKAVRGAAPDVAHLERPNVARPLRVDPHSCTSLENALARASEFKWTKAARADVKALDKKGGDRCRRKKR